MANWSDLKAAVASIVKTNGNKEITGQLLQNVLNSIISNVGLNSTFAGIASPYTNPGTPDGNVFYLATTAGTYSNFDGIEIKYNQCAILKNNAGGKWLKSILDIATATSLLYVSAEIDNLEVPYFIQGEFNYNLSPVELNDSDRRIKTLIKVKNIDKILVKNPIYALSAGIVFGKNKDLSQVKRLSSFSNIKAQIDAITDFEPYYLMFSIKKAYDSTDNPLSIVPSDVDNAELEITRTNEALNKGLLLNTSPIFTQGEFNINTNPITMNSVESRIKTIFNIANINSISITNTEYEISAGFITNADMDLTKSKCYVLDTISEDRMSVNVKSALLKISAFNPSLLVLSFRKKNDNTADILPGEGSKLGLKFDVLPIQKEIDNLDRKIGNVVATIENRYETGFEQGEFNFNYNPVAMTNDPLRIRRVFDITDLTKITVGNPNAEMRYYVLMQENESLSKSDVSYGGISSNEVDLESLKRSATFNATKILISFGYKDKITPISPTDAKDLVIEGESLKYQRIEPQEIVCWGDSLTAGDGVGEYPKELKDLLGNDYIVYNQGVGGETSHTILARLGSECMVSDEDFILSGQEGVATLIADGTLNKYLKNATTGSKVTPLLQASTLRINPCYVNGIECTLYREFSGSSTNAATNKWYIKPNISTGYNLTIKANTPIICQASKNYRNKAVNIVWVGTNDGTSILSDIDSFIKRLKESDNFARPKCTIYINPHTLVSAELDNAMRKEFGNRFFNWREFISTVGLYKYGITPTTRNTLTQTQIDNDVLSDIECMESGKLPSSLWRRAYRSADDSLNDTKVDENAKDSTHMNVTGYKILAKEIYNLLIELGMVNN